MKIKTPYFNIEIELIFIIIFIVFVFFPKIHNFLISFYICYLFILFHELSHVFIASILGKDLEILKISLAGVSVKFNDEKYILDKNINTKIYKLKNIFIYFAGPVSNLLISIFFIENIFIFQINIFLFFLNLIPIYPLDGYNILDNCLSFKFNYNLKNNIIELINNFILVFMLIFCIAQFLITKKFSIFIFLIYIFLLKKQKDSIQKITKYYPK
jgi:stage IV sporulation protein FB